MTCIVWRPPFLASDSRVTEDNTIFTNKHQKLLRLKNGGLVGSAGDADDTDLPNLLNKLKGKIPTHKQLISLEFEFVSIVVQPDGSVYVLESICDDDKSLYKAAIFPIKEPFIAIGSGAAWATGALSMGASAEQAVKIAIKHDSNCGGAVQILQLEGVKPRLESKE